jgi:glucose/arabinose dehydrogenase
MAAITYDRRLGRHVSHDVNYCSQNSYIYRICYTLPIALTISLISVVLLYSLIPIYAAYTYEDNFNNGNLAYSTISKKPVVNDDSLDVQIVSSGLKFPTTMAFLTEDDILVLERFNGTVRRVLDNVLQPKPLLDVNVADGGERGMLGIAVSNRSLSGHEKPYVFLFYTEAKMEDGGEAIGNRLYRYDLVDNKLVKPKLLLDLPISNSSYHNGGAITIGPDYNVYVTIGDLSAWTTHTVNWRGSDFEPDLPADGSAGILRVNSDGDPMGQGIIGNRYPLNLYFAYGIRNSFGIGFDPVTGKLWDTENGPRYGDEINLVDPGFNSGWNTVQGLWVRMNASVGNFVRYTPSLTNSDLVNFGGRGEYSDPEFSCRDTTGFTAVSFPLSDQYMRKYNSYLLVGATHHGNIYQFKLTDNRTSLSPISYNQQVNNVANCKLDLKPFASGFGAVTDLEMGADGFLYIVSYQYGTIYRIIPRL